MLCLCLLLYAAALRGGEDRGRRAAWTLLLLAGAAVLTGPGVIHVGVTLFDMFNEGFLFSQKLTAGRYDGDEAKKDIHERNVQYLQRSAKAAAYCCRKLGWKKISCTAEGKMRTIEDISAEIRQILGIE